MTLWNDLFYGKLNKEISLQHTAIPDKAAVDVHTPQLFSSFHTGDNTVIVKR